MDTLPAAFEEMEVDIETSENTIKSTPADSA